MQIFCGASGTVQWQCAPAVDPVQCHLALAAAAFALAAAALALAAHGWMPGRTSHPMRSAQFERWDAEIMFGGYVHMQHLSTAILLRRGRRDLVQELCKLDAVLQQSFGRGRNSTIRPKLTVATIAAALAAAALAAAARADARGCTSSLYPRVRDQTQPTSVRQPELQ